VTERNVGRHPYWEKVSGIFKIEKFHLFQQKQSRPAKIQKQKKIVNKLTGAEKYIAFFKQFSCRN
jgi:hypothetical protein